MRTGSRTRASDRRADPWARAALGIGLLALLAGGARQLRASPVATPIARPASAVVAEAARAPAPRPVASVLAARSAEPAAAAPPASLRGTTEDGALRQDDDGELVIGPEVLRLFDYYLSATGEESGAALRARILAAIRRKLPSERAARRAIALLDDYLGYREAARRLAPGGEVAARLEAVRALRRERFGDVAELLFGSEERAVAVALEQRDILGDRSLTPADRDRRLAEAEARLPDAVREAREASTRPLRERADEEAMRAAGASDADLHAARVAADGPEAADRLAELDRRRASWAARLQAFRAARAALQRNEPDPDRQRVAVTRLLDASFTSLEQVRVDAADRLAAETRSP